MITTQVKTENPSEHWEFIECNNEVAVDLGCGRWEKIEYRDPSWLTTPEWLLHKGASHVYAYDIDPAEVEWYNTTLSPSKNITAYHKQINNVEDIREIFNTVKPTVVKCDIEGYERAILDLSDVEFLTVKFYAIETHSDELYSKFVERFNNLKYEIIATVDLIHAPPMKAIFAKRE